VLRRPVITPTRTFSSFLSSLGFLKSPNDDEQQDCHHNYDDSFNDHEIDAFACRFPASSLRMPSSSKGRNRLERRRGRTFPGNRSSATHCRQRTFSFPPGSRNLMAYCASKMRTPNSFREKVIGNPSKFPTGIRLLRHLLASAF